MQNVIRVHRRERIQDRLQQQVQFLLRGAAADFAKPILDVESVDILLDNVGGIIGLKHARDSDNVSVLEPGQDPSFPKEALFAGLVVSDASRARLNNGGLATLGELGGKVLLEGEALP